MKSDPVVDSDSVVDRVRKVRHEISARFGHDPKKLTTYYIERQKRHRDRLICATPITEEPDVQPGK